MKKEVKIMVMTRGDYITMLMLKPLMQSCETSQIKIVLVNADSHRRSGFAQLKAMWKEYDYRYFFFELFQFLFFMVVDKFSIRFQASVESISREYEFELLKTADVNSETVLDFVSRWQPDMILSAKCPQNIGQTLLKLSKYPALNIHGSLLPKYAGRAPHFWAMSNGEKEVGFTIHEMTSEFDGGNVFYQQVVPVLPGSSVFSNIAKVARESGLAVKSTIEDVLNNKIPYSQNSADRSYFSSPTKNAVDDLFRLNHSLFRFSEFIREMKLR